MADNTTLNPGTGGDTIRSEEKGGAKTQVILLDKGGTGAESLVTDANPLPVELASLPLPSGAATAANQATGNTTLASILTALGQTLAVGGTVTVSNLPATQAVSGTVTANLGTLNGAATSAKQDAIIAALGSPLQAGGLVSIAGTVPVSGPLTDAQLRATAVPVSGTVGISGSVSVTGTFWQATQPVSAASLPLPDGAATEATLASMLKEEDTPAVSGDKGVAFLTVRASADASTASQDGDYAFAQSDEEGRVKVSSKPASYADVTGDITAVQASIGTPVAGGTVIADVSRASNVMMFCTGTFSTVNCTFEGSIEATGENWFGVQAVRSNANTIETATGNLSAAPAYAWELSVNALARVRVRCTARTSGTQSWRIKLGTYATEPIPAAQVTATQPVSGTLGLSTGSATVGNLIRQSGFTDSSTALASSGTFTGTGRVTTGANYREFVATAFADQSGTLFIDLSVDTGTTYRNISSVAVAASIAQQLSVRVTGAAGAATLYRVRYVNGATLQGAFQLSSAFVA